MTLIELLVVISVLLVLMGLLVPALMVMRGRAHDAQARSTVAALHQALQNYAAAERRHRYPPMAAPTDRSLRYDPAGGAANLNLLTSAGFDADLAAMDRSTAPWTLLDPFGAPFQYSVDDNLLGAAGAQRPLDLAGWNAAGRRPWAYVWSTGRDRRGDGRGWIYQADGQ